MKKIAAIIVRISLSEVLDSITKNKENLTVIRDGMDTILDEDKSQTPDKDIRTINLLTNAIDLLRDTEDQLSEI